MSTISKRIAMLLAGLAVMLTVVMAAPATSEAQEGSDLIFGTVVTCIESDTVQGDPAASTMGVGNVYEGNDGTRHLITTGAPLCKFNCADGFDINCDGVRGDYCEAGLDLSRVADVGKCLAAQSASADARVTAAPAAAAGTGGGDASASLAYTGNETAALAIIGGGLLAAGALVIGTRRKIQD